MTLVVEHKVQIEVPACNEEHCLTGHDDHHSRCHYYITTPHAAPEVAYSASGLCGYEDALQHYDLAATILRQLQPLRCMSMLFNQTVAVQAWWHTPSYMLLHSQATAAQALRHNLSIMLTHNQSPTLMFTALCRLYCGVCVEEHLLRPYAASYEDVCCG